MPDGNPIDVRSTGRHLSWGEKHSFALILFMFDAISRNAELIILDDPISSFDSNKKYAIINRLFKTGDKMNSLYQKTVLMLTHDFEPVIDYIQVGSGRQDSSTEQIANGVAFIKEFISDFDYSTVLAQCTPKSLMERYSTEQSAYIKMLILRAYTEQDEKTRDRLRKKNDVLRKYVDETYHIENDYLYSLDVHRFNIVPDHYIDEADMFVANEKTISSS